MRQFVIGQRWVSASEPELGLGMVAAVASNRVTIIYLACGEQRIYAQDNAPLTRVKFLEGDHVETEDGLQGVVKKTVEQEGVIQYHLYDQQGELSFIDEVHLSATTQFNRPQDKLFIGQAEIGRWFSLRYQTWQHLQRLHKSQVKGLLGARASLIAHQVYIAHEVALRDKMRVMLADEVGLGKTIEAGLILHHSVQVGLCERILVIVPDSLLHQWLVEMLRRFNLKFSLFDESRCLAIEDENPFLSEQLVLSSLGFFQQNPHRQKQAVQAGWDMVVVDEAHHLHWNKQVPEQSYVFVEQLAEKTEGLILLTATPEQLGQETHFAQLRLLDADRFHSFEQFLSEQQEFEPVAQLAEKILKQLELDSLDKERLSNWIDQELCTDFLLNREDAILKQEVLNQLVDRHGTGRVLFRNSRHVVQGFPQREYCTYPIENGSDNEETVYLQWLVKHLEMLATVQVLLICRDAHTVLSLHKQLRDKYAINAAAFHDGMSILERDRAAAYFADPEATVRILLCSEIGSEGRNFQFVYHLILLDLPENPDLLQQRIGRLDRIGQKRVINIHVPYIVGSKQHSLCRWYGEGLKLFQENSNAASAVYRMQKHALERVCMDVEQIGLDKLVSSASLLLHEVEAQMQQSRDVLLELNSCRLDVAGKLIGKIEEISQPQLLWRYMEDVFDCFGVDSEYHSEACVILRPGQLQRVSQFPELPDGGVTATVSREIALAREDMQYLTWEHPMLVSAMDLILSGDVGNAAFSVIKHEELAAGQYLLECLFLVECSAPLSLQLSRFLPATPIRVLIDQKQRDLTSRFEHHELLEIADKIEIEQLSAFVGSEHKNINAMIAIAEKKAELRMHEIVTQANEQMLRGMAKEIKRLEALVQINSGIRPEEIITLKDNAIAAHGYIADAKLRLDAVRFIISS